MKTERRRFPRAMIPVYYRILKHPAPRRLVNNLSMGGVRIYSDEYLDTGQTLGLEFFLPNGVNIEVDAQVVWIREQPLGSGGIYDVGLEFINPTEASLRELRAVLKKN